jgi:hypothetical protein
LEEADGTIWPTGTWHNSCIAHPEYSGLTLQLYKQASDGSWQLLDSEHSVNEGYQISGIFESGPYSCNGGTYWNFKTKIFNDAGQAAYSDTAILVC